MNPEQMARACNAEYSKDMTMHIKHLDAFLVNIVLAHYAKKYKKGLVLYGGQTATPQYFGFKKMRVLTNDLDFAVIPDLLPTLIKQEGLMFHPVYQVFFCYQQDVLCVFSCEKIHDWLIPPDFFKSAVPFTVQDKVIFLSAREYMITLKLLRGYYNNKTMFGKDSIDIINLLSAPIFRTDLEQVDLERTVSLIKTNLNTDVIDLFGQIFDQLQHVPEKLRDRIKIKLEDTKNVLHKAFI